MHLDIEFEEVWPCVEDIIMYARMQDLTPCSDPMQCAVLKLMADR